MQSIYGEVVETNFEDCGVYWTTGAGITIPVNCISDNHLDNILNHVEKRYNRQLDRLLEGDNGSVLGGRIFRKISNEYYDVVSKLTKEKERRWREGIKVMEFNNPYY